MDAQFNHQQQSPEVVELVNSYFEIAVDFVSSSDILAALCGDLETCAPALLSQVAGPLVAAYVQSAAGLHAAFLQGAAPIHTSRIKNKS